MRTISFWLDDAPRCKDLPMNDRLPDKVDVAIVGSGYTGLSAAIELARAGASVVVLERHEIGWGASSRNGGMILCGFQRAMPSVFSRFGVSLGRELWQASLDAVSLVERIHREDGLPLETGGELLLAAKPSHREWLRRDAEWFHRELGHSVRYLCREELSSEIGSNIFHGGLCDTLGGGIHPVRFVYTLAQRAIRGGAILAENTSVRGIERAGPGFLLRLSSGTLCSSEVLLATSGYTELLVKGLKRRVIPVGSYIIVTEPLLPEVARQLSPTRRMMYDSKNFLNYFRLLPDGRLLWGGRYSLATGQDLCQSAAELRQGMLQAFPYLEGYAITHSWTGHVDVSADRMPHLGRIQGIWYALGYGGHGTAMATYLGREAARRISGTISRSPFEEIPHPAIPFYRDRTWFLPLVSAYYWWKDWTS